MSGSLHVAWAFLSVALGGAIGASLRYALMLLLGAWNEGHWPVPIFVANLLGCLFAGMLFGWFSRHPPATHVALLLSTGVLGGFTTFSAFSVDALELWLEGHIGVALAYAGLTLLGCLLAVRLGYGLMS